MRAGERLMFRVEYGGILRVISGNFMIFCATFASA
jgi:hypothetical protein